MKNCPSCAASRDNVRFSGPHHAPECEWYSPLGEPSGLPHPLTCPRAPNVVAAVSIACRFGHLKHAACKQWVIDQMLRALLGEGYTAWREEYGNWDEGAPPHPEVTS